MTKQKPKKFGKPKSFSKYSNADPLQKTSLLSKVFGNQRKLDDARDSFFSSYDFESNIIGRFNIYNIMASVGCALNNDINISDIISSIKKIKAIPGRMEFIGTKD